MRPSLRRAERTLALAAAALVAGFGVAFSALAGLACIHLLIRFIERKGLLQAA